MTRLTIEGNKGGSYITIETTSREDVVRLQVGHDCVNRIDQEVNVWLLAEILAKAKEFGFDKIAEDVFDGEVPEWVKPV